MFHLNRGPEHGHVVAAADAELLGHAAVVEVERVLGHRPGHVPTPLHALPSRAKELGLGALFVKDEGFRLGLGSFKALGGAYAVVQLVLEEASLRLGRRIDPSELTTEEVRAVAADMTFACATDGNHGRSVAQGAELVGGKAAIFVHDGVSEERIAAIARFGATIIRVAGTYDDSVRHAARVAEEKGWIILSDTSWPGYERIPGLVMQGYTAMVREALRSMPQPPTHVFVQAGVGGVAASVAGHLAIIFGEKRPIFVVVEPRRAACLLATARAGRPVHVDHREPTVMAMLECYEPSLLAWRVLSRVADAFMTVDEDDAIAAMNVLARPTGDDPSVVAGESGGAGYAGVVRALADPQICSSLGLATGSRVLVFNTESATDPGLYARLVGLSPDAVLAGQGRTCAR